MYISLLENSRGHPNNVSFMQFSTKIDGFEQKDSQGFENSYNSFEQYPLEIFFIFTIYQNYTLALSQQPLLVNEELLVLDGILVLPVPPPGLHLPVLQLPLQSPHLPLELPLTLSLGLPECRHGRFTLPRPPIGLLVSATGQRKSEECIHLLMHPFTLYFTIGDFRNVFKFHAYSVNKRLFLTTAKLAGACPT